MEEHCLSKKNAATITFTNCKFIFPKDEKLPYLPENAEILSSKIIYSENNKELKEISISAKYLDFSIFYKRQYQYLKNNIEIRIMIKDNQSTENFVENFKKVNL